MFSFWDSKVRFGTKWQWNCYFLVSKMSKSFDLWVPTYPSTLPWYMWHLKSDMNWDLWENSCWKAKSCQILWGVFQSIFVVWGLRFEVYFSQILWGVFQSMFVVWGGDPSRSLQCSSRESSSSSSSIHSPSICRLGSIGQSWETSDKIIGEQIFFPAVFSHTSGNLPLVSR